MTTSSEYAPEPAGQAHQSVTAARPDHYHTGSSRASDRWPWVAVALVAAIAAVAVAVIVTVGNEQHYVGSPKAAQVAFHRSSPPKVIRRTVHRHTTTIVPVQPAPSSAPAVESPASGSCAGISLNSQTSCPFAQNVVEQYSQEAGQAGGAGSFNVNAYSPVTGRSYTDACNYSPSANVVSCSHGSDLIQFAYGDVAQPAPSSAPAVESPASGSCAGISLNSQTSCPFAQNVVEQYSQEAGQAGGAGSFNVNAYSPVTGRSYTDACNYSPSANVVSCSHGSDLIQFAYTAR